MEKRHFIKVASSYSPKNKLCKQIIDALEPLDGTLCEDKKTTISVIDRPFNKTVTGYLKSGGKAIPPAYKRYEITSGVAIHIEDVIIIHIHAVTNEVTAAELEDESLLVNKL